MSEYTDSQRIAALAAGLSRIVVYEHPEDKKRRCRIEVRPPGKQLAGVGVDFLRMIADALLKSSAA